MIIKTFHRKNHQNSSFWVKTKFNPVWDCSQPMSIPPMFPNTKGNGLGTQYSRKSSPWLWIGNVRVGGCVDMRFLGEGFGVVFVMHMRRARALICDIAESLFWWFLLDFEKSWAKEGDHQHLIMGATNLALSLGFFNAKDIAMCQIHFNTITTHSTFEKWAEWVT